MTVPTNTIATVPSTAKRACPRSRLQLGRVRCADRTSQRTSENVTARPAGVTRAVLFGTALFLIIALAAQAPRVSAATIDEARPVDLVIALDTSGSMTQLIDSARAKLWEVVNELALAKPHAAVAGGSADVRHAATVHRCSGLGRAADGPHR